MKVLTKIKFVGAMVILAGGVGFLVSRYGGQMRQRLQEAQKKRALQAELASIMGEKARVEEELRQLEGDENEDEPEEAGDPAQMN